MLSLAACGRGQQLLLHLRQFCRRLLEEYRGVVASLRDHVDGIAVHHEGVVGAAARGDLIVAQDVVGPGVVRRLAAVALVVPHGLAAHAEGPLERLDVRLAPWRGCGLIAEGDHAPGVGHPVPLAVVPVGQELHASTADLVILEEAPSHDGGAALAVPGDDGLLGRTDDAVGDQRQAPVADGLEDHAAENGLLLPCLWVA